MRQLQAVLGDLAHEQPDGDSRHTAQRLADTPSLREVLVGVLGPSGAGKTTLVARLTGVEGLKSGPTVTTRIPTLVLPGTVGEVRLVAVDGGEATSDDPFQASVGPDAAERWQRLEVEYRPARFPALAFFDLPGLGLSGAGRFGERYDFLARCDLLLLCWPATMPLAHEDAAALGGVVAPRARRIVALTRADLVEPEEIDEIVKHLRSVAGLGDDVPVIPVGGLSRARAGARRSPGFELLEQTLRQMALEEVILPAAKAVTNAVLTLADRPRPVRSAGAKRLEKAWHLLDQEQIALREEGADRIRRLNGDVGRRVAQATSVEGVAWCLERGLKAGQAEFQTWINGELGRVEKKLRNILGQVWANDRLEMAEAEAVLASVNARGVGGGAGVVGTRAEINHLLPFALLSAAGLAVPGLGTLAPDRLGRLRVALASESDRRDEEPGGATARREGAAGPPSDPARGAGPGVRAMEVCAPGGAVDSRGHAAASAGSEPRRRRAAPSPAC